jgi:hypothetical protein
MGLKPVVIRSIQDATGNRCVDIIHDPDGHFAFVECRSDPEDAHGWRRWVVLQPSLMQPGRHGLQSPGWVRISRDHDRP